MLNFVDVFYSTLIARTLFLVLSTLSFGVAAADTVYYSTPKFEVTDFDLQMYLRDVPVNREGTEGSRARNLQALSDLYALRLLDDDAQSLNLVSDREQQWISSYAVAMENVKRYLEFKVASFMETTNWESEAQEYYLAKREEHVFPETVSIRTFLIRAEGRSLEAAVDLAKSLISDAMTEEEFLEVVRAHTEDEAGAKTGGLMENVVRGQTVKPFEDAAFALRDPYSLSDVVVTRYGAHVIQLLQHTPAKQKTLQQALPEILPMLQARRKAQYLSNLREEARVREPTGFRRNLDALDELLSETSDGPLRSVPAPE